MDLATALALIIPGLISLATIIAGYFSLKYKASTANVVSLEGYVAILEGRIKIMDGRIADMQIAMASDAKMIAQLLAENSKLSAQLINKPPQ